MTLRIMSSAIAAAVLAMGSVSAHAQMSPGLWEHSVKFKSQNGEMEKQLAEAQARMEPPPMGRGECTQQVVSRTSTSMKVKWACTGKDPSHGEGEMHFSSDKAFTGHAFVDSVRGGKPEHMDMDMVGKWLSSDCGDVKPRTPGKP